MLIWVIYRLVLAGFAGFGGGLRGCGWLCGVLAGLVYGVCGVCRLFGVVFGFYGGLVLMLPLRVVEFIVCRIVWFYCVVWV